MPVSDILSTWGASTLAWGWPWPAAGGWWWGRDPEAGVGPAPDRRWLSERASALEEELEWIRGQLEGSTDSET